MFLITDAINMIREIRGIGGAISRWGFLLNIPQLLGGLIFIRTPEGLVVLVCVIATLFIAGQIHKRNRFSRLIGICHLPWLIMLPWLLIRMATMEHGWALTLWLAYVCITVAISLIFDVWDVARYLKGDKTFNWAKISSEGET